MAHSTTGRDTTAGLVVIVVTLVAFSASGLAAVDRSRSPTTTPAVAFESDNETSGENITYGICVIGVDSPCNGDAWDGNSTEGSDFMMPFDPADQKNTTSLPGENETEAGDVTNAKGCDASARNDSNLTTEQTVSHPKPGDGEASPIHNQTARETLDTPRGPQIDE